MTPIRPFALAVVISWPSILFSSCATVLNGSAQQIRVATDKNITGLRVENSLPMDSAVLETGKINSYIVPRGSTDLVIHFRVDTAEKMTSLRPRNSFAFWLNIWANYGIGMLMDRNNPRRYSYPSWTYLTANDRAVRRYRYAPVPNHTLRLSVGYSPVNILSVASPEGQYNTGGIYGLEAGLDYFYKPDRYVSLSLGGATSALPIDYFAPQYLRTANVLYANFRINYVIGSFDLGYGINSSELQWVRTTLGDTVNLNKETRTVALGLSLSAQYRLSNNLRIGLLFQPDLLNINRSPAFQYQHYIALGLYWKFPLH